MPARKAATALHVDTRPVAGSRRSFLPTSAVTPNRDHGAWACLSASLIVDAFFRRVLQCSHMEVEVWQAFGKA